MADAQVGVLEADDSDESLLIGEAVALDLRPTGFILRGAGAAIDVIATYLLLFASEWVVGMLVPADSEQSVFGILSIVISVFWLVAVPVIVETATRGLSLGRLAIGSRIVRDDGGSITFRHALIRGILGVLEFYLSMGGVALVAGLLSPRSKRLGDLLAGTYGLQERVARPTTQTFGVPVQLAEWAQTADVARMPDGLSRRVAQFLSQTGHFTPERRRALAASLANEVARYVSPVPAGDPELFLAAATVVRRERESRALALEADRLARLRPALTGLPHAFPARSDG